MIIGRPFHVLELRDQDRLQPTALLHFVSRQTLPPSPAFGFREVCEWALGALQVAEPPIQLFPRRRRETIARSANVQEPVGLVAAED